MSYSSKIVTMPKKKKKVASPFVALASDSHEWSSPHPISCALKSESSTYGVATGCLIHKPISML